MMDKYLDPGLRKEGLYNLKKADTNAVYRSLLDENHSLNAIKM